ncbi:MAG: hydroxyisourate hydrolase [Xanthobacteraceae bacterium]
MHQGKPAAGLLVLLFRLDAKGQRSAVKSVTTNDDGRTDAPLLDATEIRAGAYELVFAVGDYFSHAGVALPSPAFLDEIPVRFSIADPGAPYHVPLLFSPWAYSTYRGS